METIAVLKGIKKYFSGTKALNWEPEDTMIIKSGEIHGLVGENGAGKSTLFQSMMGIYPLTGGSMELYGKPYTPKSVKDAEEAGIAIIMQQPNFAFNLTVAENIFLGQDRKFANNGIIDWKKQNAAAAEILHEFKYDHIKPGEVLSNLGFEATKQVEIARALSQHPKILLVDETSAAISRESVENLYALLREQRDKGTAILYISHFIDEVYDLCDTVTIMRDGKYILTVPVKETTAKQITTNMVGRDVSGSVYRNEDPNTIKDDVIIETKNLSKGEAFKDVNLKIHAGEIVGIAGIGGCGSDEFGRVLFGYEKPTSGEIIYEGKPLVLHRPEQAVDCGIGFIPKDRDKEGLFLIYNSVINISAANMRKMSRHKIIDHRLETQVAKEAIKQLKIKTPSEKTNVSELSGGNRQKVAIAKWIANDTNFLIVNSPTRGVDVGVKYGIYNILEKLKLQGKAVLLISDELPELIGMCDRVYCFKKGQVSGEFSRGVDCAEETVITKMV